MTHKANSLLYASAKTLRSFSPKIQPLLKSTLDLGEYEMTCRAAKLFDWVIFNWPVQWRHSVHRAQLAPGGDDVVALLAVALDLDPPVLVPVLDHHHQAGPTLGQVVRRHAFSPLMPLAWKKTPRCWVVQSWITRLLPNIFLVPLARVKLIIASASRWYEELSCSTRSLLELWRARTNSGYWVAATAPGKQNVLIQQFQMISAKGRLQNLFYNSLVLFLMMLLTSRQDRAKSETKEKGFDERRKNQE